MPGKNQISMQTLGWYYNLFGGDSDADAAFHFIRECGFDAIDYNFEKHLPTPVIRRGELTGLLNQPLEEILAHFAPVKAAARKHGVAIAQAHAPYPQHVPEREDIDGTMLVVIQKVMEVCRFLECPALVVHPVKQWTWEENLAWCRKLIPAGIETGVTVCVENMFVAKNEKKEPFFDAADNCRLVDMLNMEAGRKVFGCCYDTGHANISGRSFREDMEMLGDRVEILHIHDNNGTADQHLIPYTQKKPGTRDNCTDWEELLESLRRVGYGGPISFETHCALRDTPKELVPETLRFIASVGKYFQTRL